MAAYPSIALWSDSKARPFFPSRSEQMGFGGEISANNHGGVSYEFTLTHKLLTEADKNTLTAFFETNEFATDIALTWLDGIVYNCTLAEDGWTAQPQASSYWLVTANLIGKASV